MPIPSSRKIRVGIVGLQPGRSWAAVAHLPALSYLADDFEVVGVANSSRSSALAAADACGIPRAFTNVAEMAASPEIDLIAVTVKVPAHLGVVRAVIEGGKHVFCEWPVGRDLREAETMAALVRDRGVQGFTSTQSRVSPAMQHMKQLIDEGYVGEILSTDISGWGRIWGPTVENLETDTYLLDSSNGATMLTIPFAHTLAAARDVVPNFAELSAVLATRVRQVRSAETDTLVPMSAADQIRIAGTLENGAVATIRFQGGEPRGIDGFVWDVHGTEGDLRMTGPTGHPQIVPLNLFGGRQDEPGLRPIAVRGDGIALEDNVAGNIARIYRRIESDLRAGTHTAPTFDDAHQLHRLLDQIKTASREGKRVKIQAPNRLLPAC